MEKITKEKFIQLSNLYASKDDIFKIIYKKPILYNDYFYITNRYIMLKIKLSYLDFNINEIEYNDAPKEIITFNQDNPIKENINKTLFLYDIENALNKIPEVDEEKETIDNKECEECLGTGVVEYEYCDSNDHYYYKECDCPICDGEGIIEKRIKIKTGKKIKDEKYKIILKNVTLSSEIFIKIIETMKIFNIDKIEIVNNSYNSANLFKINNDIEIYAMPFLNNESEYSIEIPL